MFKEKHLAGSETLLYSQTKNKMKFLEKSMIQFKQSNINTDYATLMLYKIH